MDIVFKINDIEKVRYDYENEFAGERQGTRELVAYENNCNIEDVKVFKQKRVLFDIKVQQNKKSLEYNQVNYKKSLSILSECILFGYRAEIKTSDNKSFIINDIDKDKDILQNFMDQYGCILI